MEDTVAVCMHVTVHSSDDGLQRTLSKVVFQFGIGRCVIEIEFVDG